jgi:hypothetical protein
MMRLSKLASFLVFLAILPSFATGTHAALIAEYQMTNYNSSTNELTVQGGSYTLNNPLEGHVLFSNIVAVQDTNGYKQQMRSISSGGGSDGYMYVYNKASSELWLTATTAQTVTLSFNYWANAWYNFGAAHPLENQDTGIAQIYVKVGDNYYLNISDKADPGSLVNQFFTAIIVLNPNDKLIIGCYSYGGFEEWHTGSADSTILNLSISSVPVPGGLWLLGSGLLGLAGWRRFRKG